MSNTEQEVNPKEFSALWHCRQVLQHGNYVAFDDFPQLWKWNIGSGSTASKLVVDGDGESEDVFCRVVGLVSDDRPYLETQGNFNPKFAAPLHKSKLQFTLKKPDDIDFGHDSELAYKRMEDVQNKIAQGSDRSWFLSQNTMRFSFPLWEPKNDGNNGADENELTENYKMRSEFYDAKNLTQENHQVCIMRVSRWGCDDLVEPTRFSAALMGALVDVTFTFKHFFFKSRDASPKDVNSYSALVSEIVILKPAPPPVRSPFQDRKVRGALGMSQSPRKLPGKSAAVPSRAEQEAAAVAFASQAVKQVEKRKRADGDSGVASSSKKAKEI